ncbi:Hypothetical protein BHY_1320 (plasmid) [Borrelia nietonii YOR]|uniref:Uncharacterized protein n=2 Tax=Borrelia TaxID=138 RepID=W5SGL9_9SPIR|nr:MULTISPECIES: DUF261 family protein [Borrelia]AHH04271.1 Hypothetical protein BHY_1320 [Borrelia nietonii YOR]AHH14730.1 Hypothetical protein BHW_0010902 [Borrelia hermsii MTW]UPA10007.1 DUF261 family protein [Borrelia nietonii YOR]
MKNNCYILNSFGILQSFGIKTSMLWESHIYRCTGNEFEISEVKIKGVPGYHL